MAEQLQNLLDARHDLATLEERNRLARDLHDSVKQQVFAITMQLGAARSLLATDPDEAARHLAEAEQLAKQSQQELAGLIQELRPSDLNKRSLVEALRTFVEDWSRRTMMTADFQAQDERPLPLPVEQALFRVAQEALANVARHSRATTVTVHLDRQADTIYLTVQEDGQGFVVDDRIQTGMGLSNMTERMTAVDGSLTVTSSPGQGTTIEAAVRLTGIEMNNNDG
jgi:NarL family two-component system sensor histidine kinase LiaS